MKLLTEVIHRLCATPKNALVTLLNLTRLVRCLRLKRAAEADSSQGRKQLMGKVYAITAFALTMGITEAQAANYSIDHLKLYAHSRILDYKEFQCFNRIITKESRWSYTAKNGSLSWREKLHRLQAATRLSGSSEPPLATGITWSHVLASPPHQKQIQPSRLRIRKRSFFHCVLLLLR